MVILQQSAVVYTEHLLQSLTTHKKLLSITPTTMNYPIVALNYTVLDPPCTTDATPHLVPESSLATQPVNSSTKPPGRRLRYARRYGKKLETGLFPLHDLSVHSGARAPRWAAAAPPLRRAVRFTGRLAAHCRHWKSERPSTVTSRIG